MGYTAAFYLLSLVLDDIPVGVAYGTWAACGIVLITAIGVAFFDEQIDLAAVVGILFIVCGVYLLNVISKVSVQ